MQTIDVLRDDAIDVITADQFGYRAVSAIGFGVLHIAIDNQFPAPCFAPCVLRRDEVLIVNGCEL